MVFEGFGPDLVRLTAPAGFTVFPLSGYPFTGPID